MDIEPESFYEENSELSSKTMRPVIYRRSDYIGGFRHLIIFAVDGVVLLILTTPLTMLSPWLAIPAVWVYLAVLKPSRFRSPGYWVTNAKIVTLDGRQPSIFRMTLRLSWMMLWTIGWPISIYLDWLWVFIEEERQMLCDYVFQTRLVRHHAQPIGPGRIHYVFVTAPALAIGYARVRPMNMITSPVVQYVRLCLTYWTNT